MQWLCRWYNGWCVQYVNLQHWELFGFYLFMKPFQAEVTIYPTPSTAQMVAVQAFPLHSSSLVMCLIPDKESKMIFIPCPLIWDCQQSCQLQYWRLFPICLGSATHFTKATLQPSDSNNVHSSNKRLCSPLPVLWALQFHKNLFYWEKECWFGPCATSYMVKYQPTNHKHLALRSVASILTVFRTGTRPQINISQDSASNIPTSHSNAL